MDPGVQGMAPVRLRGNAVRMQAAGPNGLGDTVWGQRLCRHQRSVISTLKVGVSAISVTFAVSIVEAIPTLHTHHVRYEHSLDGPLLHRWPI